VILVEVFYFSSEARKIIVRDQNHPTEGNMGPVSPVNTKFFFMRSQKFIMGNVADINLILFLKQLEINY